MEGIGQILTSDEAPIISISCSALPKEEVDRVLLSYRIVPKISLRSRSTKSSVIVFSEFSVLTQSRYIRRVRTSSSIMMWYSNGGGVAEKG